MALWIAVTLLLGILPYVVGYTASTEDQQFVGYVHLYPEDPSNHLSWARQAQEGQYLFEDKNNGAEPQTRLVFNALFLAIGGTARLLHIPLMWAFHLWRLLFTGLLLWAVFRFTEHFLDDPVQRWTALLLISFSSGFGWLAMLGLPDRWGSADLWMTEVSTFIHSHTDVTITPAVYLLLTIFDQALRFGDTRRRGHLLALAVAALGLAAVHPHNLVTVAVVLALYPATQVLMVRVAGGSGPAPTWLPWLGALVGAAPVALYHLYAMLTEPLLREYASVQDFLPPLGLVSGFGVAGLLAALGAARALVVSRGKSLLLLTWIGSSLVLAYTPLPLLHQFYLLQGLHVGLCILAAMGLPLFARAFRWLGGCERDRARRVRVAGLAVLVLFASLTNLLVLCNEIALARGIPPLPFFHREYLAKQARHAEAFPAASPTVPSSSFFLPRDFLEATQWLARHTDPSSTVLAPPYLSTFIPLLSGNRVYAAAVHQTSGFVQKAELAARFYAAEDPGFMGSFLEEQAIDYVLFWFPRGDDKGPLVSHLTSATALRVAHQQGRALILSAPRTKRQASR